MKAKKTSRLHKQFDKVSRWVTTQVGHPAALIVAIVAVIVWAATGPLFHFDNTWQLVINTSTTIITFLMVFIIQQSQNRDTVAIQLKLNELIAANCDASNRLVNIEDLTEDELNVLKKYYVQLAKQSEEDYELYTTHSIDEAKHNQDAKQQSGRGGRFSEGKIDARLQQLNQASDKKKGANGRRK